MHTSTDGSPEATAPEHSPAGGLPAGLVIALIVAASLLTLSVFLPWATWHSAFEKPKPAKHFEYGTQATGGEIVVLAGMAALTLAFIVRAVSHRFAGYTVVPGVLSLVAIGQYGFTYRQGNAVLSPALTWEYWVAMAAAAAVAALGLVAMRRRTAGRDQS